MEQLALSLEQRQTLDGVIGVAALCLDVQVGEELVAVVRDPSADLGDHTVRNVLQWAGRSVGLATVPRELILERARVLCDYDYASVRVPYDCLGESAKQRALNLWAEDQTANYDDSDERELILEDLALLGLDQLTLAPHRGGGWTVAGRLSYVKQSDFVAALCQRTGLKKYRIDLILASLREPRAQWFYSDGTARVLCAIWLQLCKGQKLNAYRVEGYLNEPARTDGKDVIRLDIFEDVRRYLDRWVSHLLEQEAYYHTSESCLLNSGVEVTFSLDGSKIYW